MAGKGFSSNWRVVMGFQVTPKLFPQFFGVDNKQNCGIHCIYIYQVIQAVAKLYPQTLKVT